MPKVYQLVRSGQLYKAKKTIQKQILLNALLIVIFGFFLFALIKRWFPDFNIHSVQFSYFSVLFLACFLEGLQTIRQWP